MRVHLVDDKYLYGHIGPKEISVCPVCNTSSLCITIERLVLPEKITYQATILHDRTQGLIHERIGVDCGCYARLHRQLAHITQSMKERSHVQ